MAGVCSGSGPCDTHPTGHGGDNFVSRGGGFDPYLRAIINALKRKGHPESQAVQIAIGTVQRWARGEGNVSAVTRARAAASLAHWEALKARTHSLTACRTNVIDFAAIDREIDAITVDLAWNEALHPRKGGKFAPKGTPPSSSSSSALPPNMAANVRDFQKRMGLPVTGVIDTATAAKIKAEVTPKGPKGRKGKSKATLAKRARAAQRKTLGQHVATVNGLSTGQRATVRQRMPVPPTGYVWTASNNLRAVPLTAAQQAAPLAGLR